MINTPNYIHLKIIKLITDYLLVNKKSDNNDYSIKRFKVYENEIISMSLVSKCWFEYTSSIISDHIIKHKLFNEWISPKYQQHVEIQCDTKNENDKIQICLPTKSLRKPNKFNKSVTINSKYSIIKLDKLVLFEYFRDNQTLNILENEKVEELIENESNQDNDDDDSDDGEEKDEEDDEKEDGNEDEDEDEDEDDEDEENEDEEDDEDGEKEDDDSDKKTNNSTNKITKTINIDINYDIDSAIQISDDMDDYGCENSTLQINKLRVSGSSENDGYALNFVKFLKPKIFICEPNLGYEFNSFIHTNYFEIFNSEYNSRVEHIKIKCLDFVEIGNLDNIKELKKLKSLSVPIAFDEIGNFVKFGNQDIRFVEDMYSRNFLDMEKEWNNFIESLSINDSLKQLCLYNYNGQFKSCFNYTPLEKDELLEINKFISNGIQSIISSTSNKIHHLKLVNCSYIVNPKETLSPLINNQTIKNLEFGFSFYKEQPKDKMKEVPIINEIVNYLFSNVFTNKNTSIRHFGFYCLDGTKYIFDELFNQLKIVYQNQQDLSLYSISLTINYKDYLKVLELIKKLENHHTNNQSIIKEFNLKIVGINQYYQEIECIKNINSSNKYSKDGTIINMYVKNK